MRLFTVALCLLGTLGIPSLVSAQFYDPYADNAGRYLDEMEDITRRQREQADLWKRYAPQRDPLVEYYQRRDQMRNAEIFGCTSIDRNPAARAACLDAVR